MLNLEVVLHGQSVYLRPLVKEDVSSIFQLLSDPDVCRYTRYSPHLSLQESQSYLDIILKKYRDFEPASLGIVLSRNHVLIGTCGFLSYSLKHKRAEISYEICKNYWGQGHGTEAVLLLVRFGFDQLGLNRIEAFCEPENLGSRRVMEKVGMKYEGYLREYVYVKQRFCDCVLYAILREDFEARRTI